MNTPPPPEPAEPHRKPPPAPRRRPRQCAADYRWTVPKVTAFLEALALSGRVADAARAVGMSRQSAYKLRARLDGPRFRAAFEGARKTGIRARMAASVERNRSQWEGPGLAALDHLRGDSSHGAPQGDIGPRQGDTCTRQGDARAPEGDGSTGQDDAFSRKPTKDALDCVTSGPGPAPNRLAAPACAPVPGG